MSYREVSMQEIKEVLRRKEAGQSARQIARSMGLDRKTLGRYLSAVQAAGIGDGTEVTDEVLSGLGRTVQARPQGTPSEAWQALGAERARIQAWLLTDPPLRLVRVHELLQRDGVCVGYTTLRRFVRRELGWHERPPTVLLADPPPGEEAQVGPQGRPREARPRALDEGSDRALERARTKAVRLIDAMPVSPAGKILKRALPAD